MDEVAPGCEHKSRVEFCCIRPCKRPKRSSKTEVWTLMLSTFIKLRGIRHISHLKVDAQGLDFHILQDVLLRTDADVEIDSITAECQRYDRLTHPMYEAFNDCSAMKELVRGSLMRRDPSRRPVRVSTTENNCRNAEYDLHFATR